jgi:hypothetical protein
MSVFDTVREKADPIYNFYVDAFGFYSLRETFFPYVICMAVGTSIMLIAETIKSSETATSSN